MRPAPWRAVLPHATRRSLSSRPSTVGPCPTACEPGPSSPLREASLSQILDELGCGSHPADQEAVARACACNVQGLALGLINIVELHLVGDLLHPGLEREDLVIAGHDGDGLEFESLGEMHGADGNTAGGILAALG